MGNPHVVFFDRFDPGEVLAWGPLVTRCPTFPAGVNAGFAEVLGPARLRLTVHERGAGFTQACGTGACAAVAAGVQGGVVPSDLPVEVQLPGGTLEVVRRDADGHLLMTGPAVEVFEGIVDLGGPRD
jgi:diaminopimelate epimerase